MHSLFSPVQGFANALVYGLNRKIMNHYASLCCRCNRNVREYLPDDPPSEDGINPNPSFQDGQDSGRESDMSSLNIENGSGDASA